MQLENKSPLIHFTLLVFLLFIFQLVTGINSPWVLVSCGLGFIAANFKYKAALLIPLSLGHFFFTISFNNWVTFQNNFLFYLIYFSALLVILYLSLWFTEKFHRFIRLTLYLFLACTAVTLHKLGLVSWFNQHSQEAFRLLFWPMALLFALDSAQFKKIKISQIGYSLFPSWNMQLFHNVPTENQEDWAQVRPRTQPELRRLQLQGLFLIALCIIMGLIKLGANDLMAKSVFAYLSPLRLVVWRNYMTSDFSWYEKLLMIYFNFSYILLHFTLIGTFANACAKIWGYDFHLNVNFFKGTKILTQWNLLFYYLNQLVVQIFFNPFCEALAFIRHRKIRISLAMILSIYLFGFLYLVFLFSDQLYTHANRGHFVIQRCIYLGVLCLFGLVRIWGPRKTQSKLLNQLSPYIYFLIFAPMLMFGMLTMDLNFTPF